MIKYYTRKFFIPALGHVYGLSDQILLSAGSFITIIILARWSTSEIVGLVAIALNVSTFFLLIHKGISTTFTVIVSSNDLEKQKSYLREFILIHLPLFTTLVV